MTTPEGIYNALNPNPPVVVAVLLMGVATVVLPRKYALFPLFIVASYITLGQYVVIASANFTMVRILVVFGLARALVRSDHASVVPNGLDKAMIAWAAAAIITYTILWQSGHAFINRVGMCFDTAGVYLVCRLYCNDTEDVNRILRLCAVLLIPLAIAMAIEFRTGKNLFSFLGGVPLASEIRDGRVRCQGSFRHPILMGTFGATMLPLIVSLWWKTGKAKVLAVFGTLSCITIVACAGSSGALMATGYGIVGLCAWPLRFRMRSVRWLMVLAIIILQFGMKAPFWYVLARLSSLTGGTGWHRAYLIDQAIRYFGEWWFVGTRVTAHWMPTGLLIDPTKADITNQYLVQGVNGGIITMLLFIAVVAIGFAAVGRTVRILESEDFSNRIVVWSMGSALFAHAISFISVSYFDQIQVFWYFLMAAIAISLDHAKAVEAHETGNVQRVRIGAAFAGRSGMACSSLGQGTVSDPGRTRFGATAQTSNY
jgi:hypothetical protein